MRGRKVLNILNIHTLLVIEKCEFHILEFTNDEVTSCTEATDVADTETLHRANLIHTSTHSM